MTTIVELAAGIGEVPLTPPEADDELPLGYAGVDGLIALEVEVLSNTAEPDEDKEGE